MRSRDMLINLGRIRSRNGVQ